MWEQGWRNRWLAELNQQCDLLIIGGGICGAGILREASRAGVKALLIEQNDFASGTSSKSSKLVHGGLRYLRTGEWRLTLESVRERERLLRESSGLVRVQGFITAIYSDRGPGWWLMKVGLWIYDFMARKRRFYGLDPQAMSMIAPRVREENLVGGFWYPDAQTDDARLTLRVLSESLARGARAINYLCATDLIIENDRVVGVRAQDRAGSGTHEIRAKLVINAAGVWCDRLRLQVGGQPKLRPLRGSHLIFEYADVPAAQAITLFHPDDGRPVFVVPWEGKVLVGTTDLDHSGDLDTEPHCTKQEAEYLLKALRYLMPGQPVKLGQAISAWAGVRPVISSGTDVAPSKESREHALWDEKGLLTITGGKLTTYRTTALQLLEAARAKLPEIGELNSDARILDEVHPADHPGVTQAEVQRLYGRYGAEAEKLLAETALQDLQPIEGTPYLWAELAWSAEREAIVHLQDLLLRRLRIGLLVRDGGAALLPRVRTLCQSRLGWDDVRWQREERDYLTVWRSHYAPPQE